MAENSEYKELFLAEAQENFEELNRLFTQLEKNTDDKKAIDSIFRITHTLKGNAMGLGFEDIADMSHVLEDVFSMVKNGKITLDNDLFTNLFKAVDKLGALIEKLKDNSDERVGYKGIKTKLEVFLRKAEEDTPVQTAGNSDENPAETDTHRPEGPVEEEDQSSMDEAAEDESSFAEAIEDESSSIDATEDEDQESAPKIAFSDSVQIPVRKLDNLLNLVGELIIERDSLIARSLEGGDGSNKYARLERITSDLQYSVMDVRLVQVGFLFNKFHRVVRDVCSYEGKEVDLHLEGTEIEIDRNILKIISDSMVHLVRNAVSHGVESPEERKSKGKPAGGKVTLKARNEKDTVYIDVIDDGKGIDAEQIRRKVIEKGLVSEEFAGQMQEDEIIQCIFEPGFSNAEKVTEVSGRGVGMDVVKRAVESIGGKVNVTTKIGQGSTVTLSLPSSMAVKGALLLELSGQEYAIPLSYTEAVVSLRKHEIHKVSQGLMASYLGRTISVVFLKDLFRLSNLNDIRTTQRFHESYDELPGDVKLDVVIVSYSGRYVGFVVDKLIQQKEIVEKSLNKPVDGIEVLGGATILGNGSVCFVLDISSILNSLFKEHVGSAVKNN